MATKVTPLYAETRILLQLTELGKDKVSKSNFVPTGNDHYKEALDRLSEEGCLSKLETNVKNRYKYSLTSEGRQRLIENLFNEEFFFFSNIGTKTTNGMLKAFRELKHSGEVSAQNSSQNGYRQSIESYDDFSSFVLNYCQKIDAEDNLDGLIPIYRVRREVGKTVDRDQFDDWLFELQADNQLQMMGDDLSDTPQDQKDDSVQIPGGNLRFYIKLL